MPCAAPIAGIRRRDAGNRQRESPVTAANIHEAGRGRSLAGQPPCRQLCRLTLAARTPPVARAGVGDAVRVFRCPIAGCDKVFRGSRGGWDGHVGPFDFTRLASGTRGGRRAEAAVRDRVPDVLSVRAFRGRRLVRVRLIRELESVVSHRPVRIWNCRLAQPPADGNLHPCVHRNVYALCPKNEIK